MYKLQNKIKKTVFFLVLSYRLCFVNLSNFQTYILCTANVLPYQNKLTCVFVWPYPLKSCFYTFLVNLYGQTPFYYSQSLLGKTEKLGLFPVG